MNPERTVIQRVEERLRVEDIRDLNVFEERDVIVISGEVPDHHRKSQILAIARGISWRCNLDLLEVTEK